MKIVHFCTNSNLSGAPVYVAQICSSELKNKYDFIIVMGGQGEIKMKYPDLDIVLMPELRSSFNPIILIKSIIFMFKFLDSFDEKIVLHCHSTVAGVIGKFLKLVHPKPIKLIYTVHGWGFGPFHKKLQSTIVYILERTTQSLVDFAIFVSNFDEVYARSRNIKFERSKIVYNSCEELEPSKNVQLKNINLNFEQPTYIFVARVGYQKDHQTFFEALSGLSEINIIFVGEGTDSDCFINNFYFHAVDFRGNVNFLGQRADVHNLMRQADYFVLISRYEGLPISIVEAMSIGLVPIVTDVGGCSEIVQSNCGYLIDVGDGHRLHEVLRLTSRLKKEVYLGLSSECRRYFMDYLNINRFVKEIEQIYAEFTNATEK